MFQFTDLNFKAHPAPFLAHKATQALVTFPNGHSASVVWGVGVYGTMDSYEVWRSIDEYPITNLDESGVTDLLRELESADASQEKIGYQVLPD